MSPRALLLWDTCLTARAASPRGQHRVPPRAQGLPGGGARVAASGSSPGPATGLSGHHCKPELLRFGPDEPSTGPEVRNGVWRVGSPGRRQGEGLTARFPQQAHSSAPAPAQRTEPRPQGLAGGEGVSTYNQRRHAGTGRPHGLTFRLQEPVCRRGSHVAGQEPVWCRVPGR